MTLFVHADEDFEHPPVPELPRTNSGWSFRIGGTGFQAQLGIHIEKVAS